MKGQKSLELFRKYEGGKWTSVVPAAVGKGRDPDLLGAVARHGGILMEGSGGTQRRMYI